jgi:energy-coupling factor transporter ATP-binding protein EcfA2
MTEGQDAVPAPVARGGSGTAGATVAPAPAGAATVTPGVPWDNTDLSAGGSRLATGDEAQQSGHGWPGEPSSKSGAAGSGTAGSGTAGSGTAGSGTAGPEPAQAPSGTGWPVGKAGARAAGGRGVGAAKVGSRSGGLQPADGSSTGLDEEIEPYVRVDARKLEAALLGLRHPIVSVPLLLEAPGVTQARAERHKLLSQIDDYLLPRLRQSGAPILIALVGSTGAGKSTLVNSLVGKQVSATGIRRPTTNSPVLACHPNDVHWFAENVFLPTLPRVRQQGLAMPGRDGLLVLAACEGMPEGVALLDTPDIDSVVEAHHEFAHQFLDASDLWLFVTTARRYADAAVWDMLKDARDRGAALAIALSRVPPAATRQLAAHFDSMLEANGLRDSRRFIIPETVIAEARLPAEVTAPVKQWLFDTARREDRRVAVLTQTMAGVLDTFRRRIPALADQVTVQLAVRRELRELVDAAYAANLADFDESARNGAMLTGEVLARWQDFAGTGDLLRALQVRRRGGQGGKSRNQRLPGKAAALKAALRTSLESLVCAVADRAAEQAVASWLRHPAGAAVLARLGGSPVAQDDRVSDRADPDYLASALADLGLASPALAAGKDTDPAALARASSGLLAIASRAVGAWQEQVLHVVRAENVTKRSIARVVSFDDESLALVLSIGVLGYAGAEAPSGAGAGAVPQEVLTSLFGAGLLRDMGTRIRLDLHDRVDLLLEQEARRFAAVLDGYEAPADTASTELLQAGYTLEAAR